MNMIQKMIQNLKDQHFKTKKRWFIQFPIPKNCNFRCSYCFHQEYFNRLASGEACAPEFSYYFDRGFSLQEWNVWYDTHIRPISDETVIHLQGGDPFCETNLANTFSIMDETDVKVDILTNGIGNPVVLEGFYKRNKNRIYRIGFTFHRKTITTQHEISRFSRNVKLAKKYGVNVYVKEIYFREELPKILEHREQWNKLGIPLKIQDFQNLNGDPTEYTSEDLNYISDEYKHKGQYCSCWEGWRSISVRGFDIGAGDVIACWLDPKIIGNIKANTFDPNFKVLIDTSLGRRNVIGVPIKYNDKGTYSRDRIEYVT